MKKYLVLFVFICLSTQASAGGLLKSAPNHKETFKTPSKNDLDYPAYKENKSELKKRMKRVKEIDSKLGKTREDAWHYSKDVEINQKAAQGYSKQGDEHLAKQNSAVADKKYLEAEKHDKLAKEFSEKSNQAEKQKIGLSNEAAFHLEKLSEHGINPKPGTLPHIGEQFRENNSKSRK